MKSISYALTLGIAILAVSCARQPGRVAPIGLSNEITTSYPASEEGRNLALGSTATTSVTLIGESPSQALDGDPSTYWTTGSHPAQWIQIDLGNEAIVAKIKLVVAQNTVGISRTVVLAGISDANLTPVGVFEGETGDNQVLVFTPSPALSTMRFMRILTTDSPTWMAWREIEVFGQFGSSTQVSAADVIYYGGRVLTLEKDQPTAEAIAILGDKILAVGSDSDVMQFEGNGTKLIDIKGLTLTPGFIDSHSHRIGDRWQFGDVSAEQMMEKALSQGWTSNYELFVNDQRLAELVDLARANKLPMRISMYLTMNNEYDRNDWWRAYQPLHQYSPYLQIAGLKITLDREWGEQVFFTQEQYTQMVLDATRAGWQVATHSFSPKANQIVLNGYESALNGQSNDTFRLRLEHIGTLTDDEMNQMARLGIIGSVQFLNAGKLIEDASFKKYIPFNEVEHTARWRDLLNAGVFLIANTDDPWCCTDWRNNFAGPSYDATVVQSIYQGVTRTTFEGRVPEPWQVAQTVTVQEALEMLTIKGAYAAHLEDVIGSLKPGKYADIVILSGNPLALPVEQIPNIQVVMTMVGGEVQYCEPDQQAICQPTP